MGKVIGGNEGCLVCAPVLGGTKDEVLAELACVLAKGPDVVEWRADFFKDISATDQVIELARRMKEAAPETTMIFTVRSQGEGGEPIPLGAREVIELTAAICRETTFEYVDCELNNDREDVSFLREAARRFGKKIIASYHNFTCTPDPGHLLEKLLEPERLGLDVAKVAVMPQSLEDVLVLLRATLEAKSKSALPVVTMSMGGYGAVTRMIGGVFGSALTFGVAARSSAPGQVPIEELRTVMAIIAKALDQEA